MIQLHYPISNYALWVYCSSTHRFLNFLVDTDASLEIMVYYIGLLQNQK